MKHYIAKKLGMLMPGNASAHLAGAAVATDHDDEQRCFEHSLAAAFSRVMIVSHAQAYELPAVTHEQARQLNVDDSIAMWLSHQWYRRSSPVDRTFLPPVFVCLA